MGRLSSDLQFEQRSAISRIELSPPCQSGYAGRGGDVLKPVYGFALMDRLLSVEEAHQLIQLGSLLRQLVTGG